MPPSRPPKPPVTSRIRTPKKVASARHISSVAGLLGFVRGAWFRRFIISMAFLFGLFLTLLATGITYVAYNPYVQKGIPVGVEKLLAYSFPELAVKAESFSFHWNIPSRSLVIDLGETVVNKRYDKTESHQVKSLRLQFPVTSLARFQFWPRNIWASGLQLEVKVPAATDAPDFARILQDALGSLRQILNLYVRDAKLTIVGEDKAVKNLETDLTLDKNGKRIDATLVYPKAKSGGFRVQFSTKNQKKFRWNIKLESMKLKDFFDKADFITPELDAKKSQLIFGLQFPVSGSVEFVHDHKAGLQKLLISMTAEKLNWVDQARANQKWEFQDVRLESTLTPDLIQLRELSFLMDSLKVSVNGESRSQFLGGFKGQFAVNVEQMTIADLVRFWPTEVASVAREWIQSNLSGGVFHNTRLHIDHDFVVESKPENVSFLDYVLMPQAHKLANLRAEFDLRDVNVRYMDAMPLVEKVSAMGKMNAQQLHLTLSRGQCFSQNIQQGHVLITELDQKDQNMHVDLTLEGLVQDALRIANHDPLRLLDDYDLKPEQIQGNARTTMTLDFPLERNVERKDVKVKVDAKVTALSTKGLIADAGLDLEDSECEVSIVNFGDAPMLQLSAKGQMLAEAYALQLVEHFPRADGQKVSPFKQQLTITTGMTTRHFQRMWGMPKGFVVGKVPATFSRTIFFDQQKDGHDGEVLLQLDFKPVKIEMSDILLHKPHDEPLSVHIKGQLVGGKALRTVSVQSFDSPALNLEGNFHWNGSRLLHRGDVQFRSANNLMKLDIQRAKNNELQAGLTVKRLDLKSAWERFRKAQSQSQEASKGTAVLVNIKADAVMYGKSQLLSDLSGALEYNDTDVTDLNLVGHLLDPQNQSKKNFTVSTRKDSKEGPKFVFVTEDFGLVLRAMGFETQIKSGKLRIEARKVSLPDTVFWRGEYVMENFVLEKAPGVLKLIKVVSPTIITEVFDRQKGVKFDRLDGRFRYDDDSLNLYQGQALSPSLGLTFEGNLDLKEKTVDMTGTMIPAYGLNAAVGYIPVIGQIFAGGPGEGLVAFNFTMQGDIDDPTIQSNPLSALTPGFLRKLMRGSTKQTKEEFPENKPQKPAAKTEEKPAVTESADDNQEPEALEEIPEEEESAPDTPEDSPPSS